jgi:hypothetical protein
MIELIFGVSLEILRFFKKFSSSGIIHKKVGADFPGETFRVLKENEEMSC